MFTSYDLVMRDRDYDHSRQINLHRLFYAQGVLNRHWFYDMFISIFKNKGTGGYQVRMKKHQVWLGLSK